MYVQMRLVRKAFCLVVMLLMLNPPYTAFAQSPWLTTELQLAQAGRIDKAQAAAIAKSAYGGKVLKVSKSQRKGKTVFSVKLVQKSGRVRVVSVDGSTGKVSGG